MTAYKQAGRRVHTVKIATVAGEWIARTTGTRVRALAEKMQGMCDDLGPQGWRAWDVIDRLEARTLTVAALWDLWTAHAKDLKRVRAALNDVDLEPLVEPWRVVLLGPSSGVAVDTAEHYVAAVRTLLPAGVPFKRSQLTSARLVQWLEEMTGVRPATVRKRGAGMRRFTAHLVARGLLLDDPAARLELPPADDPRCHYLETVDAKRLADAQPAPYNAYSALLAGSGVEVSVALALRRRDVDVANREIRAPGTKTYARDRVVRVAEWAWVYVDRLLAQLHPDALIFDTIPHRWAAADMHNDAVMELVAKGFAIYAGYTMRDARHTYAVRAIRAGTPAELVARQLGHVNAVLVHRVYGRFSPTQGERDKWERIAAAQDAAVEHRPKGAT